MELRGHTIPELAAALAAGKTTSRELTEAALAAIEDDPRAFLRVHAEAACRAADASDRLRASGVVPSALAGIPISVKDLFDVAGEPTPAGSTVLRDAAPAGEDAVAVARLRAAGAVIVGRTHMTEFAFSGVGANPHFPPAPNPVDPARVPGGSSSGAAVSVAQGAAAIGLGTDTGGSTRIPAALCGLVGYKPTKRRISCAGVLPLSQTLDSVGPIARNVDSCRIADTLLADAPVTRHAPVACAGLRFLVPTNYVLDQLDTAVAAAFASTLARLADAGVVIEERPLPVLSRVPEAYARGTIAGAEAFAWHRRRGTLEQRESFDPNVLARIEHGGRMLAADLLDLLEARAALMVEADRATAAYDAVLMPTVPIVAPRFADVADAAGFAAANALLLRNPMTVNFLDRCAISIPMPARASLPTGLMLVGETDGDARLFALAQALESALAGC
jgi:aspartyl-tRNA(Asn)/glutamyl-tRNA(Gln) amidotransferase subunit A